MYVAIVLGNDSNGCLQTFRQEGGSNLVYLPGLSLSISCFETESLCVFGGRLGSRSKKVYKHWVPLSPFLSALQLDLATEVLSSQMLLKEFPVEMKLDKMSYFASISTD